MQPTNDRAEDVEKLAEVSLDTSKVFIKIGGIFPLSIKYIRTDTHIALCEIKEQIHAITGEEDCNLSNFSNPAFQKKYIPLFRKYLELGLINNRFLISLFSSIIRATIKQMSYHEMFFLYLRIMEKNDPAYFFVAWTSLHRMDGTILKVEKQS